MNTDNIAISGETIDYGPCAFMDRFAAGTVFRSIDATGRYSYGRQPQMMCWNMARFSQQMRAANNHSDKRRVGKKRERKRSSRWRRSHYKTHIRTKTVKKREI